MCTLNYSFQSKNAHKVLSYNLQFSFYSVKFLGPYAIANLCRSALNCHTLKKVEIWLLRQCCWRNQISTFFTLNCHTLKKVENFNFFHLNCHTLKTVENFNFFHLNCHTLVKKVFFTLNCHTLKKVENFNFFHSKLSYSEKSWNLTSQIKFD